MIDKKDKVHGKSFVIIGGDVQLINTLERMLFFAGANVQASPYGRKGISYMRDLRPDILVLETSVTDIESEDLINTLQEDELTMNIPVIVIASSLDIPKYKKLFKTGTQDFMPREEFDVMQIILKIEAILRQRLSKKGPEVFDFSESEKNISKSSAVRHLRLLVVEDDPLLRNLLSMRLTKSGIQFEFCHSGSDAIALMQRYQPTVVILDLMLPGKNGIDVLAEMRTIPEISDTPVIIFSNRDDDIQKAKAAKLGVHDFLIKATTDLGDLIMLVIEKGKSKINTVNKS